MEVVKVRNAARLLGGEVEEGEAVAAEVGPVVVHLEGVADGLPLLAVKAVAERGLVGEVAEITGHAEPNLFE